MRTAMMSAIIFYFSLYEVFLTIAEQMYWVTRNPTADHNRLFRKTAQQLDTIKALWAESGKPTKEQMLEKFFAYAENLV